MFERYTEESRRTIFFARYEASQHGTPFIETEHLLLGILREGGEALRRYLPAPDETTRSMRAKIDALYPEAKRQKISTSIDLPLSLECKRALAYGAEIAEAEKDSHIRPEHLLLGLLREEGCRAAEILRAHGATGDEFAVDDVEPSPPSLQPTVQKFAKLLRTAGRELSRISESSASAPLLSGGWSSKQVLGHLIDSASNNHQRFVRALLADELSFPKYEQESWVHVQSYQDERWSDLVALWTFYNRHLLHLIRRMPEESLAKQCRIGDNAPMTLGELAADYLVHLEHHLTQLVPQK